MAESLDESLYPKISIECYIMTPDLKTKAIELMAACLRSKPAEGLPPIERYANESFMATYINLYFGQNIAPLMTECGLKLVYKPIDNSILSSWDLMYTPIPPSEKFITIVNHCLIVLLCAKQVRPEFYLQWAINRAKALFQVYNLVWVDTYRESLLSFGWAALISKWLQQSQALRTALLVKALNLAQTEGSFHRKAYEYATNMLRYARLTTIVLTRLYITSAKHSPILLDDHLNADRIHWHNALNVLEAFPVDMRPFAGIIADMKTASALGGKPLHNLTYIAVQVAMRSQRTLENFQLPADVDAPLLNRLIHQYFPTEGVERPLEDYTERDLELVPAPNVAALVGSVRGMAGNVFPELANVLARRPRIAEPVRQDRAGRTITSEDLAAVMIPRAAAEQAIEQVVEELNLPEATTSRPTTPQPQTGTSDVPSQHGSVQHSGGNQPQPSA